MIKAIRPNMVEGSGFTLGSLKQGCPGLIQGEGEHRHDVSRQPGAVLSFRVELGA